MVNNIIPSFYMQDIDTKNLIESMITETGILKSKIEDMQNQFFIDTATWSLPDWERLYGLKIDNTETLENRRARVKMAMRGQGTVTKAMLKNLCKSFTNGEVDIIENTDSSFAIKFISTKGTPTNLNYLTDAIEEVKPAHLAFSYLFRYLLIKEIHEVMTLEQFESTTLDKFAF